MARQRILIVDDEEYVRDSLSEVLDGEGFACKTAGSLEEAMAALASATVHAIVTDLSLPSGDGIALLEEARRQGHGVPILVMTGVGTVADAVKAMKAGAFDFLQKPVDPLDLVIHLRRALEHQELVNEVRALREGAGGSGRRRALVGRSEAIARVRALIEQVAPTDAPVLVSGESGTGKELVASEIHAKGERAGGPLVRVNCAAIPETLFESEFFGHRRGAFSGAIADRVGRFSEAQAGTIVLDEIGALVPDMQAKLLRVLENGEYQVVGESRTRVADARVVALTNENLPERVQRGQFRADLYWRLNVFPIALPPLRQRKEDLADLCADLLASMAARRRAAAPAWRELPRDAFDALASYDWPGNVRELRNVLERAAILCGDAPPSAELVRSLLEPALSGGAAPATGDCHLRRNLDALEKDLILRAIERAGGVRKDAAGLLGIDPRNLGYYLRKHGLGEAQAK